MHFIIGFACLAGIYHLTRGHRRGRYRGGRGGFKRKIMRHKVDHALSRIDASPEQASEVHGAFESLTSELCSMRDVAKQSKQELLDALRSDEFAEAEVKEIFNKQQNFVRDAQGALSRALERIHSVLEPEQRAQIIEMISTRSHSSNPYR